MFVSEKKWFDFKQIMMSSRQKTFETPTKKNVMNLLKKTKVFSNINATPFTSNQLIGASSLKVSLKQSINRLIDRDQMNIANFMNLTNAIPHGNP